MSTKRTPIRVNTDLSESSLNEACCYPPEVEPLACGTSDLRQSHGPIVSLAQLQKVHENLLSGNTLCGYIRYQEHSSDGTLSSADAYSRESPDGLSLALLETPVADLSGGGDLACSQLLYRVPARMTSQVLPCVA